MAWTASIVLDADKADVGTATATWNKGQADEFTHSARVRINIAGRDAFVAAAKAALSVEQTKRAAEASYSANLAAALNA